MKSQLLVTIDTEVLAEARVKLPNVSSFVNEALKSALSINNKIGVSKLELERDIVQAKAIKQLAKEKLNKIEQEEKEEAEKWRPLP